MKAIITFALAILFSAAAAQPRVKTGIEVLRDNGFAEIKGLRVGLVTNPTAVDSKLKSTIDILHEAPEVKLVALYSPEHGVRGNINAGDKVEEYTDAATGVKVFSLYGRTRKPTAAMLEGIDIIIFDIQDIGSRSYTFISTMGLVMEAAAENGKECMILDRPNPVGGIRIEGNVAEPAFYSFVGKYPIPYVHGMTCGELAQFINSEGLLKGGVICDLRVVPMSGWRRDMTFEETGLPWIPTSPHIPHATSPYFYPMTGIMGEIGGLHIGVGYTLPFQVFATEWIADPETLARNLNKIGIKGITFRPTYIKPYYGSMTGKNLKGVQMHITDYSTAELTLVQFYVIQELNKLHPTRNPFLTADPTKASMFDKVCGTDKVRKAFMKRYMVEDIKALWSAGHAQYKERREPYLIY